MLSVASPRAATAGPPGSVVHLLTQIGHGGGLHTHQASVSNLPAAFDTCRPGQPLALTVMATRLCVVGSVNADLTFTVDALPRPGQTVLASSLLSAPGGKGGNQAVAAARAGATVQLVAALGTDGAAEQLRTHLRANGVGLDGVVSVPGPSGSAAILVDAAAENCIVVAPGANGHLSLSSPAVRAVVADSDVRADLVGDPDRYRHRRCAGRAAAGATVVLNASPAGRGSRRPRRIWPRRRTSSSSTRPRLTTGSTGSARGSRTW